MVVELRADGGDWAALGDAGALLTRAASAALDAAGLTGRDIEISVLLTDDDTIRTLNRDHRGQDKATNVLSWPAFALAPPSPGKRPPAPPEAPDGPTPIGDIALAAGVLADEALQFGIVFVDHATHLMVHGVLHLLGYDHETEADAELMEGIERHALARLGVADPYL